MIKMHAVEKLEHRQLIQLRGSLAWCYQQCMALIKEMAIPYFWLGDAPLAIQSSLYKQILGQETSLLIINAHQQFDANMFAGSEGTLRGNGLLLLISPRIIDPRDLFYCYIDKQLSTFPFLRVTEGQSPLPLEQITKGSLNTHILPLKLDQEHNAIEAIIKTVTGHRRRPLVLTANRGRGKSAALGIAAAQLIAMGYQRIIICAPNKNATNTLFRHAGESEKITFVAPDLLLTETPSCDLLMIDEAAALPVAMLESLTKHYPRLVFATTLHGYEGSGRGFALRFQQRLSILAPQWRALHLDQPIRWDVNDPLELFTQEHLCLTQGASEPPNYQPEQACQFSLVSAAALLDDTNLLADIFSLLVIAHYQTKPSDLEKLLNDPSLSILLLQQNKQLLGVALINHEGELSAALADKIYHGHRRIQGHLIAQSLTFHSAQLSAAKHKFARIQRIAIHPSLQQQGLGKQFMGFITQWATAQKFDHLCAAFGATEELLRFWHKQGFTTLRIGSSKDKSSGCHSFIVNMPLSSKAKQLHQQIQKEFQLQMLLQISRHLQHLDEALIMALLSERCRCEYHHPALESYSNGNLPYEFVEFHLIELLLNSDLTLLAKKQQKLTIAKILQNRSWADICKAQSYTGKNQAQAALRSAIKLLIEENHALR